MLQACYQSALDDRVPLTSSAWLVQSANNIAVGWNAGSNLTTGGNNIDIGHSGVAGESNTIRIGTTQTAIYVAGKRGTVMCVPNPSASPRFVDHGDGTVTDYTTCLMWEEKDNTCPGIHCTTDTYTWSDPSDSFYNPDGTAFFTFLARLNGPGALGGQFAGHSDWRLPTPDELGSIVDCSFGIPCINQTVFGPTQPSGYWSTTTVAGNPILAWAVDFLDALVGNGTKNLTGYVRGVRSGL